jgi:hypothetical protein
MIEMNIPLLLDAIRTVGILVGIYYYISILRNQQIARTIDMVFQRTRTRTPEYFQNINKIAEMEIGWSTTDEFWEKYNSSTTPELLAIRSNVFSGLNAWGYLLREGLVDIDFVCRFNTPGWILKFWNTNKPMIMQSRKYTNPDHSRDFEFLYNAVKKKYPKLDENRRRTQDLVVERLKSEKAANQTE